MKSGKKYINVVVVLIAAALFGLICVQLYLLKRAFDLETWMFRQNVVAVMNSIVQKLETFETLDMVVKISLNDADSALTRYDVVDFDTVSAGQVGKRFLRVVSESRKPTPGDAQGESTKVMLYWRGNMKGDSIVYHKDPQDRRILVERVMQEMLTEVPQPIYERISSVALDSIIEVTLSEKGLSLPYAYGIIAADNDSLLLAEPVEMAAQLAGSEFRAQLFPHDVFVENNSLALYFPRRNQFLLRQLGLSTFFGVFFIALLIFCFAYIFRAIYAQKKLSSLLIEFINNMTHEFKTPISTISLASETLTAAEVIHEPKRIKKYGGIIRDESARMRKQVETILQMAALEEGEIELNGARVDLHETILQVLHNFSLIVEKKRGEISTDLRAAQHDVDGDALHIANIFHNLLDNAIKYTRLVPRICIATANVGDGISVRVRDNGIGLTKEAQKRIFDKYYRVPTGNVHDVKGFGLGLSYVQLMVKAHGGSISVRSEPDAGSTFEVYFPLAQYGGR